jgi:Protein of unknown function (DUF3311)
MFSEKRANDPPRPSRAHYWLFVVPFVWQLALAPYVNGVVIRGCPIPFAMLWQMIGVVLSSAIIAVVFRIDRRAEAAQLDDPPDRLGQ